MRAALVTGSAVLFSAAQVFGLNIVPTYSTNAKAWTATEIAVVNQAISDWENQITTNVTINVTMDFTSAGTGSYLGQWASGASGLFVGDDVTPWSPKVTQTIHFNASYLTGTNYLWFDSTPTTSVDQPFAAWDALSVARHEIGHMLGIAGGFYVEDIGGAGESYYWDRYVSTTGPNAYFDSAGMNVRLASSSNIGHLYDTTDLMGVSLVNGVRRDISNTDLAMLQKAYGYTLVPEPGIVGLAVGCVMVTLARRQRRTA